MRLIVIFSLFITTLFGSAVTFTPKEKEFIRTQKVIKIGSVDSYAPFSFIKNGEKVGFTHDLLGIISQKSGLKFEKIGGSWFEIFSLFKQGKIEMISEISYKKNRIQFTEYTEPYYEVPLGIFTNGTYNYKGVESLEGKRVAIIKSSYVKTVLKDIKGIQIVEVDTIDEKLQALLKNSVDIVISSSLSILYTKTLLYKDIRLSGYFEHERVKKEDLRFGIQKENQVLASIIKKTIQSIDYAELTRLKRKWIYENTQIENSSSTTNSLTAQEKRFLENHPTIRFRVRTSNPPFEFEQNGKAVGIAVDYIKKSAQNVGLQVEFVFDDAPLSDAYDEIENNRKKYDTLLYTVKNGGREKRFSFGVDYLTFPMMIITHKDAPYISSMKDLKNKTIALEDGFLTCKWVQRDYPNIQIANAKDTKSALEMVNNKKVFAYVGNLAIAHYMNVFGGMENLKIAAPCEYGDLNYSFVAPKEWPELTSILTKGYNQITPVEHTALEQKWFSIQIVDRTNYKIIVVVLVVLLLIILWILWWNRKLSHERKKTHLALKNLQKVKRELELKNKEVSESQQFLQSILDESPNPIIIKNYEGKFVLVNRAVAKLYGTKKENMIGKDDGDFIEDKQMADFMRKNVQEIMDSGETKIVYEDSQDVNTKQTRHFMSIKKPFVNIHAQRSILVIANDITDIKQLEREKLKNQEILFAQSKVAAMGEMIGNIAHQWRQPLSVISTAATGMLMEKEIGVLSDEKLKTTLESINDYAQYLSKTIDTFRDYIKTEKEYKEVVLQDRIKVALNIVDASFKNSYITIKTNLDQLEPIKIKLVVGELSEVLINILNNAKDALKERKIKKDPWVDIKLEEFEKDIAISIEDNAGGIPKDIISKIFEPYFTTKHQSQGTGLGLHMSYKIITESFQGKIDVENTKNGAKFIITLPKSQENLT